MSWEWPWTASCVEVRFSMLLLLVRGLTSPLGVYLSWCLTVLSPPCSLVVSPEDRGLKHLAIPFQLQCPLYSGSQAFYFGHVSPERRCSSLTALKLEPWNCLPDCGGVWSECLWRPWWFTGQEELDIILHAVVAPLGNPFSNRETSKTRNFLEDLCVTLVTVSAMLPAHSQKQAQTTRAQQK